MLAFFTLPHTLIVFGGTLVALFVRNAPWWSTAWNAGLFGMLLTAYVLSRSRRYEWGALLYLAILLGLYIANVSLNPPTSQDRFMGLLLIIVLISGALFGTRLVLPTASLGIIAALLTAVLRPEIPLEAAIATTILTLAASALTLAYNETLRQNRASMQEQQAKLAESEYRFRAVFEQNFQFIALLRTDGTVIDVNHHTLTFFRKDLDEVLGVDILDVFPQRRDRIKAALDSARTGSIWRQRVTVQNPAGSDILLDVWVRPIYDAVGNVIMLMPHAHDITERTRIENETAREQLRYRALFDNMPGAVFMVGLDHKIMMVNPGAARVFGYTPVEMMGMPFAELMGDDEVGTTNNTLSQALNADSVPGNERMARKKDGEIFPVEINIALVKDSDGKPRSIQVVARDISGYKRIQEQAVELALERERVKLLRRFITNISHDLRTPLSNIKTSSYLLRHPRMTDPAKRKAHMETIETSAERLQRIINDQLTLSKLETLNIDGYVQQSVDLNAIMRDVLRGHRERVLTRKHTLRVDLDPELPSILGDAANLTLAIGNIFANAVQYTPPGGTITVSTTIEPKEIVVSISDNGRGIGEDEKTRIFESLYRGDAARSSESPGTGLGLSIAQKVIQSHSGRIDVYSEPGRGSVFRVAIPLIGQRKLIGLNSTPPSN